MSQFLTIRPFNHRIYTVDQTCWNLPSMGLAPTTPHLSPLSEMCAERIEVQIEDITGGRWRAWPDRTDPDLSLPDLSNDVHCPVPHPLIPSENPFSSCRHGVDGAGRRTGRFRHPTSLRVLSDHYHLVAHWRRHAESLHKRFSAICTSNWTNCVPVCAVIIRCSGSPYIPSSRFFLSCRRCNVRW